MEDRKATLNNFTNFIEKSNQCVNDLLTELGWERSKLKVPSEDPGHKRSQSVNRIHGEEFPETFLDKHHASSLKIDEQKTISIFKEAMNTIPGIQTAIPVENLVDRSVPSSHQDLIINFTKDERLALYQHVIRNTPKIDPPVDIEISFRKYDKGAKMTSLTEIASYRRDIRRRNQKYRISKNPLTYREEIKNLIQLQTEAIAEYLGQGRNEESRSDVQGHDFHSKSHKKRSRSRTCDNETRPKYETKNRRTKYSDSDYKTSKWKQRS
ncbi:uncharacterized protein LOC129778925 [Toxorhynchites rutilus septentrionalis]|uniref:uncharacterized protein LOC129778925 n=1 Tax=Toxorhynchites rutilus septentrionalis TaxID=329112 RepID=UPI00247A8D76|nr:uncharacterized protein LOC129778925 [Toxorhynchites rutilus septentrionalis]XP_055642076.1 uncharacterized protein LOC129778925 [Toxorhynchites rutilus septentrionalis]